MPPLPLVADSPWRGAGWVATGDSPWRGEGALCARLHRVATLNRRQSRLPQPGSGLPKSGSGVKVDCRFRGGSFWLGICVQQNEEASSADGSARSGGRVAGRLRGSTRVSSSVPRRGAAIEPAGAGFSRWLPPRHGGQATAASWPVCPDRRPALCMRTGRRYGGQVSRSGARIQQLFLATCRLMLHYALGPQSGSVPIFSDPKMGTDPGLSDREIALVEEATAR